MLHYTHYTLYDVINKGEVTFTIPVIEDLYGLAFTELVGETKVSHIWTTGRSIDSKETEACGWDVVEFAVVVRHEFVALLGGGIERDWVIDLVIGGVWCKPITILPSQLPKYLLLTRAGRLHLCIRR